MKEVNVPQFTVGVAKLANEAAIVKARARGEMYGFTGIFLADFIERELRLMVKWRNRSAAVRRTLSAPGRIFPK